MAEWSKALTSKAVSVRATPGSNPVKNEMYQTEQMIKARKMI